MKSQTCFLEKKNKKNIANLSSAELAKRVVTVKVLSKFIADNNFVIFL